MDTKIRKIFVLLYPLNDFSKRMYEYIQGKLAELAPAYAVVETGGVGYLLHISLQTYSEIEGRSEVKLFTHFVVREDAQLFFGFSTKTERELFRQLISVSGVGGNTARMILSTYSPRELQSIITTENAVLLKNVKGLGLKTAQKIIVELSGKLAVLGADTADGAPCPAADGGSFDEALAALVMLGFAAPPRKGPARRDARTAAGSGRGADPRRRLNACDVKNAPCGDCYGRKRRPAFPVFLLFLSAGMPCGRFFSFLVRKSDCFM